MLIKFLLVLLLLFITYALCRAAGKADRWEEKWIEERKKEEFEGYKWCTDECYMCSDNIKCERRAVKKGDN